MHATKLETILNTRYGVTLTNAPTYAVLWAAEQIADTTEAKKELKKANRYRHNIGRTMAYPEFGTRLF
jgi:hypothetical protein